MSPEEIQAISIAVAAAVSDTQSGPGVRGWIEVGIAGLVLLGTFVGWTVHITGKINGAFGTLSERNTALDGQVKALEAVIGSLKERVDAHESVDRDTHTRLEAADQQILEQLALARAESSEQHSDLGGKLERSTERGEQSRRDLHQKIDEKFNSIHGPVMRLVGFHEAQQSQRPEHRQADG